MIMARQKLKSFLDLPQRARVLVYRYSLSTNHNDARFLTKSKNLKESIDGFGITYYLTTNLLSVNRQIHAEASAVFYDENALVRIEPNDKQLWDRLVLSSIRTYAFPILSTSSKICYSDRFVMAIAFESQEENEGENDTQMLVIAAQDLGRLALLLCADDLYHPFLKEKFLWLTLMNTRHMSIATIEQILLEPLRLLRTLRFVAITGDVTQSFADRLTSKMMSDYGTWAIFQYAQRSIDAAKELLKAGHSIQAGTLTVTAVSNMRKPTVAGVREQLADESLGLCWINHTTIELAWLHAKIMEVQRNWKPAIVSADHAKHLYVNLHPRTFDNHLVAEMACTRARILTALGQYPEALEDYRAAFVRDASNVEARRGCDAEYKARISVSLEAFKKAINDDSNLDDCFEDDGSQGELDSDDGILTPEEDEDSDQGEINDIEGDVNLIKL
ncbi:MAG: hypothetical protein Q9164_002413 [Protoblastenia rupestris]